MISIVYVSSACRLMDERELVDLLLVIRKNNEAQGITGLLLYQAGNFMQVIEGSDQVVQSLYSKICADPRHKDVYTLIEERIEERRFSEWSMGFRHLDLIPPEALSGFSSFLSDPLTADSYRNNPRRAYKLLLHFRDSLR